MKKIFPLIVALIVISTLSSCVSTMAVTNDDAYSSYDYPSVSVVITNGTPYYGLNGAILYYQYGGFYYYPYYCNNAYFFYRYRRPMPTDRMRWYRPIDRGYRPSPNIPRGNNRGFGNPIRFGNGAPTTSPRKFGGGNRGKVQRPSGTFTVPKRENGVMPKTNTHRTPTPPSRPNSRGNFGGRR